MVFRGVPVVFRGVPSVPVVFRVGFEVFRAVPGCSGSFPGFYRHPSHNGAQTSVITAIIFLTRDSLEIFISSPNGLLRAVMFTTCGPSSLLDHTGT